MAYDLLKKCVSIFFNILNWVLGGKLPPFGSACVIVEEQGRFLVVKLPGERVVFPGGFMNWCENPRQGAEREAREETGLEVSASELVGYYSCASDSITCMSTLSFAFAGKVVGGTLHDNMEGQPCWMPEHELRQRLSGHSLSLLEDYLRLRDMKRARSLSLSRVTLPLVS